MGTQGPLDAVPWAWAHSPTPQLHTSTWAWRRPVSCSSILCFCFSLCTLSRSFPQSRAWTRAAWGGRGCYWQPLLSSSLLAEGLLATEFLCGKQVASLIPFSVPCMGWSRPLALTKRPSCCEGGRFPEDTWVWRFPSGKNLYGVEPPHALSLDPHAFAGNRDGTAWLCRNQMGSKNRALCTPRTGYHLLNRMLPRLRTTLPPLPASPMCQMT